jgi:lipoprotein NlpD
VSCIVGTGCAVRSDYQSETYVVRAGDTLYSIAWRHNLDYRDLARWNDLGPGYRIAVGQILTLRPGTRPVRRAAPGPSTPSPSTPSSAESPARPPAAMPPASSGTPAPAPSPLEGPNARGWVWPTARAGAPRPVQGGGILLLGELGQPVRAACAGRVAYVGNGIRGYGNLIIIKHGESLLTAYAHTRELAVREGQEVQGGQVIAQMGLGPHQIAALYFEVRVNGRPVDPMPYLEGAK